MRVAFVPRSAEAQPLFYRFVRKNTSSPPPLPARSTSQRGNARLRVLTKLKLLSPFQSFDSGLLGLFSLLSIQPSFYFLKSSQDFEGKGRCVTECGFSIGKNVVGLWVR